MNRRQLLAGFVAGAAGLLVPSGVVDAAEEGRRWWALGAMPGKVTGYPSDLLWVAIDPGMPDPQPMFYRVNGRVVHEFPFKVYTAEEEQLFLARMGLRMWH